MHWKFFSWEWGDVTFQDPEVISEDQIVTFSGMLGCVGDYHITGNWNSSPVETFTPWKWVNATNYSLFIQRVSQPKGPTQNKKARW